MKIKEKILQIREKILARIRINFKIFLVFILGFFLVFPGVSLWKFYLGPGPLITVFSPLENSEVFGEKILVKGRVSPWTSKIEVNNQPVSLNGDGSFASVVKILPGENIIKIVAQKFGKKSEVLLMVRRNLTPEEKRAEEEAKAKKEEEEKVKAASIDQEIANIESLYQTATESLKKGVRIITSSIEEEGERKRIIGEVLNDTEKPVSWVKITATFFGRKGEIVDTKIGFAVFKDKILLPKEIASFKTQSIQVPFEYYRLETSWEEEGKILKSQEIQ